MSRESVLARGRAQAEARMTDTCAVGKKVRGEIDESTDLYPYTVDSVYEGPCEIQFGNTAPSSVDSAAEILTIQAVVLKLPVSASSALVKEGMDVRVLTSEQDAGLVGMWFRVKGFNAKTYSTARRFPVEYMP